MNMYQPLTSIVTAITPGCSRVFWDTPKKQGIRADALKVAAVGQMFYIIEILGHKSSKWCLS